MQLLVRSCSGREVKRGGAEFSKDWLGSMLEETVIVRNLRTAVDRNQTMKELIDLFSRDFTIDPIAARYKLTSGPVDGTHGIIFSTRGPLYWD